MKTVRRTPPGYHVIAKHSLDGYPIRNLIGTAKVGKWEEFPSDTSVGGVLVSKNSFFSRLMCARLWQNISLVVLDQNSWNLDEHLSSNFDSR